MCLWLLADLGPQSVMMRSLLRQGGSVTWGVRRHSVDPGLNEGEMKNAGGLDHRGFTLPRSDGISIASRYNHEATRRAQDHPDPGRSPDPDSMPTADSRRRSRGIFTGSGC